MSSKKNNPIDNCLLLSNVSLIISM